MGLFEHWPYTNFHDLNLDWIIKKIPEVFTASAQAAQSAETAVSAKNDAVAAKEAAQLSAENAAASEESAEQSAESAQNYAEHIADPVGGLVTGWLDDNITPTTPPVDASLTIQGAAADAKETGESLAELRSQVALLEAIPRSVKLAMDALFKKVMYLSDPSSDYATFHAWAYAINVLSISAVFEQGSNIIYDNDSLDDLKRYLTVTANYDDGTSARVNGYALSGTLAEGTSTITVTYEGKTATFNVTVTHWIINVDVSKIIVGATNVGVAPNYYNTGYPARMSYPYFDVLLKGGKTYKFTITSSINTAQVGVQAFNQNALDAVNAGESFSATVGTGEVWDSGWHDLESTIQFPADQNASPIVGARFAFRQSSSNPNISSNFITAIIIEEVLD